MLTGFVSSRETAIEGAMLKDLSLSASPTWNIFFDIESDALCSVCIYPLTIIRAVSFTGDELRRSPTLPHRRGRHPEKTIDSVGMEAFGHMP